MDCHVGGGGGVGCVTGDWSAQPSESWLKALRVAQSSFSLRSSADFKQAGINCETNAAISNVLRAMQEASDLQTWFNL
jgi:hypothetical protein